MTDEPGQGSVLLESWSHHLLCVFSGESPE